MTSAIGNIDRSVAPKYEPGEITLRKPPGFTQHQLIDRHLGDRTETRPGWIALGFYTRLIVCLESTLRYRSDGAIGRVIHLR